LRHSHEPEGHPPRGAAAAAFGAHLHPVLQRAYAARGVRSATDLDISLGRLLPVGTLAGVAEAVSLALGASRPAACS
jgi:single-stranded-DNA-specific exonuclease